MKIQFRVLCLCWCVVLLSAAASWSQAPSTPTEDAAQTLAVFGRYFDVAVDENTLRPTPQIQSWPQLMAATRAAKLPFEARRLSLHELKEIPGVALLHLRAPEQFVIAQAVGAQSTLIWENGRDRLIENTELARRFTGEALVWRESKNASWRIENPVRILKVDTIGGASELVETLTLRNTGTKPLKVEVASTSCGCTGATVSPASIMPGESGVLTAKMHTSSSRLVTVNFRSDDPQRPYAIVALQSQVPDGIVPPPTLLLNTQKGEATTAETTIQLPPDVRAVSATTRQSWLKATLTPVVAFGAQHSVYRVQVALTADAPAGRFQDEITLQLQGGDARRLVVPVDGYVSNDITVTPRLASLGDAPRGSTLRKTVIVRGPADKPFSIRSITGGNARVTGKASPDVVAAAHAVEIDVQVAAEVGAWLQERATLLLSDGRTLDVDVMGKVTEPSNNALDGAAKLRLDQAASDFTVTDTNGITRRLADLKGKKNLLLTFFPQCFTGGCAGHLASLQRELPNFSARDTEIWAVSVDSAKDQTAFAAKLGLQFPLIPDTKRQLSLLYGAA